MIDIKCIGLERNKSQTMMYSFHYGTGGWMRDIIGKKRGNMAKRAIFSLAYGMSVSRTAKTTGLSLRRCKVILKQLQR